MDFYTIQKDEKFKGFFNNISCYLLFVWFIDISDKFPFKEL